MSENQSSYQNSNQVISEQVTTSDQLSNAFDEKMMEESRGLEDRGDLEQEQAPVQEEAKETDKFASKFAALSRREKEIRSRESSLEQKIAEFEARMQELQAAKEPKQEVKEELPLEYRLKKNPLKTLEELGLNYDTLTKLALNDGELPTDMQMRLMREELEKDYKSKFEELENRLLEKEKLEEESKYNKVIEEYKSDIKNLIDGSEKYELIQANDSYELVYDVIEEHYNSTGRILDTEEAAAQVEAYLEEELRTVLKKSKKLGSMMPAAEKPASVPRQSPTLSNSLSAQGAVKAADKPLSTQESIQRAASMIRWED